MTSTHKDLLSRLRAVGTNDCKNYDLIFNIIAKEILTNYVIKKGSKEYAIIEIEFYFFSKDHPDVITYPRRVDAGQLFFHQSGVDITFQSNEDHFGGILIRGIKDLSDGYLYLGPQKCMDILWDNFNAFNPTMEEFPRLKYKDKVSSDEIHRYRRWIPIIDSERKKKISIWTDRIEHNFSPLPTINPERIEELVFNYRYPEQTPYTFCFP